jgi:hypothetical protein
MPILKNKYLHSTSSKKNNILGTYSPILHKVIWIENNVHLDRTEYYPLSNYKGVMAYSNKTQVDLALPFENSI